MSEVKARYGPLGALATEPVGRVVDGPGSLRRRELRRKLKAGELDSLEFRAMVFRTGPNRNHVRFKAEELARFAISFADKPFLRNHDTGDVSSRDGVVVAAEMVGPEMHATIRLTTERGMRDFLDGVLDRFSIGWHFEGAECSVCGKDWLRCNHYPGQEYDGQRAEVVFRGVVGKEISAVNAPAVEDSRVLAQLKEEMMAKDVEKAEKVEAEPVMAAPTAKAELTVTPADEVLTEVRLLQARLEAERREAALRASGLSEAGQEVVRLGAAGKDADTFAKLLDGQKRSEAQVADRGLVRGLRPVSGMLQMETPEDRVQAAVDWMFGFEAAGLPAPSLRSVRDLYMVVTGDHEWHGMFNPDFAQLSAASTSTLAGMVVNALNKVVKMHYDNMMTYRWYEPLVAVTPHDGSTHDVQLIMMDGMANLPTVAEGAAYTEGVVGDSKESMSFTKRGHYVGITLEAFRRSDIQRLQAIPREMVKSAIRTRSAAIAGIFTANAGVGPTLAQDSTALFDAAGHGNLLTAALADTAWAAVRSAVWSQTIPGTSLPLGMWPTFVLVPIELYDTALTLFGYGAGDVGKPNSAGTAQTVNPYANSRVGDPRPIPVAVPEWTDATDWAAMVDPRLHPVIHMAYANAMQGGGHPLPEIYEVASESNGLMFTNDTLPVKVRDWWAYGVSTYVGIHKSNVAN